MTEVADNYGI